MDTGRKYQFSWELLGDLEAGRPNLGLSTRLEVYRLMQFCFRDVMEQNLGAETTDRLFYEAGKLAGSHYYDHILEPVTDFGELTRKLQESLKEMGMGLLRMEQADLPGGTFTLTLAEDLDCSGLPELGYQICTFDEGFLAGIMEKFSGKAFDVKEIDCWCTGERTCRFSARAITS